MRRIHAVQRLRANFAGRSSWVRRALAPVLTRMPAERRFGAELVSERQVIRRAANDATFALEVQRTRLRAALLAAREADFYDIGEVDDPYATLKRLPVLTKHEVRAHSDRLLVKPPQTLDLVTTSGSSGEPAAFYLEKGRSAFEWAYVEHAWSRAGFDLDQWRAMLRGVSIAGADTRPWSAEPAFRELRLSPFHMSASNLDTYCDEIARRGIRFLHGYPSSLVPLAKHVLEQNLSALAGAVVGVFPVSEALEHWQTRLMQRAFPRAVLIPTYGLSERVAMAVATSDSIYEFYPTYGYVELVDGDGRQIRQAGGAGRIVATGFRNLGQPLLRYDTGDTAELVEAPSVGNGMVLKVCRIW